MLKHFDTPSYFEGWNEIKICYPKRAYRGFYGTPSAFVERYIDYSQDNPHHDYSLGNHCKSTGYRFLRKNILHTVGLIHDCGKPRCKTYINTKGEKTEIAHYYSHENVGAYDSFFFDTKYSEEERREIGELPGGGSRHLRLQAHTWTIEVADHPPPAQRGLLKPRTLS